ncbi:MAG: hypothetical protein IT169_15850 [Bryobacterales bacterium]|nr:hypothetical protein [Bryobacterales bacterium]
MAEEITPTAPAPDDSPIRRLSDSQLRKESKRRRIVTTALSAGGSILTMIGAVRIQPVLPPAYALLAIIFLFGLNISGVLFLFRWMAVPAKEAARRRRNSVLQMLGVTPQPE